MPTVLNDVPSVPRVQPRLVAVSDGTWASQPCEVAVLEITTWDGNTFLTMAPVYGGNEQYITVRQTYMNDEGMEKVSDRCYRRVDSK